jgi:hypothetical protein
MVAIEPLELVQVPPVIEEVSVLVPAIQIACVPDKVPATGAAVTVTVRVAVTFAQPPVPTTVYVIVAVPAAIPVTKPDVELIVAIDVAEELQVPPVTEEPNEEVPAIQMACVPVKVPALGAAVTVTVRVAVTFAQPPVPGTT